MPLTLVQHKVGKGTASPVTVTTSALGSGNLIVVLTETSGGSAGDVVSVADGTNTYTPIASAAATNGADYWLQAWYCARSASGPTTVTVTFGGNGSKMAAFVFEVSGFTRPTVDVTNVVNSGTGSGTTISGASVTTTATAGFVAGVAAAFSSITVDPAAGNEFTAGGDIAASPNTVSAACSLISSRMDHN